MRSRVLSLTPLVLLPACSNPFVPSPTDYVDRLPETRTRDIEAMRVDEYSQVEEPAMGDSDAESAGEVAEPPAEVMLDVEQVRASVLANNLNLQVALINPTIANERLTEEEAAFEAFATGSFRYANTDTPTSSTLSDAQANFYSFEPGVTIPLRTGGSVSLTAPITRSETNNSFSTLNPSYTSDLRLSISHNLLRNAGRFVTTQGIRVASSNRQISEAQTKLEIIRLLAIADRAYWRLYQARAALEVRRTQLDLAQAQLERARRIVRAGSAAEIEVLRAEAGMADQLDAIIVAENQVRAEERQLKEVMNRPELPLSSTTILQTVTPPDPIAYALDREGLTALAIDNRMEMLELELQLAQDIDAIAAARNGTLPLVVLDYSYTVNGLGGSLSSSVETARENRFEDWSVGLRAEIPLGNEQAQSRVRQAVLRRLQRLSTTEARRQAITREVLDAIDAVEAGWHRILAARQSVALNTRALEAEQRNFTVGQSTSTDVLDASSRLAVSRLAEIQAVVEYQVAQVDLAFATGHTLGANRVRWEPLSEVETQSQ